MSRPAVVARQAQHLDVHHAGRGHDRGVCALGHGHLPSARGPAAQSVVGGLPGGHQRRQVARRAPGDEHPAGFGRIARQVGDPSQGLVLGPDRAGAVDPARGDRRAGPHHEVEQDRGLRGSARDEGHRRRVVRRDRGGREHLAPDAQGFVATQTVGGDGAAGPSGQVLAGRGAVQRLRARDPVPRVCDDRAREGFGVFAVLVHPIHRFHSMRRRSAHRGNEQSRLRGGAGPEGTACGRRASRRARCRTRRRRPRTAGCHPRCAAPRSSTAPRHRGS